MEKSTAIALLCFIGLLAVFSLAEGCKCNINHPQERFCQASFAFVGTVTNVEVMEVNGLDYLRYTLEYSKPMVYKGRKLLSRNRHNQIILTPYHGSLCGRPNLVRDTKYLMTGTSEDGNLVISYCDWIEEWHKVTQTQRKYLKKGVYESQCGECEVTGSVRFQKLDQNLYTDYTNALQMSGYWSMRNCYYNPLASAYYRSPDCETDLSYCSYDSDAGMCLWKWSDSFGKCFSERETLWQIFSGARPAFSQNTECREITNKKLKRKCRVAVKKQKQLKKQMRREQQEEERMEAVIQLPFDIDSY